MDFSDVFNFSDYDRLIPLVSNSLWAGALVALIGGLVGVFVMNRELSFAVHGISELSFAGAAIFLLIGFDVVVGSVVGSIAAALIIAVLGDKSKDRNSIVAVLMPFGLGLGILALALYPGRAANKFGLLTGQIVAKKDILILISYSGSTEELKNIIKYANRNKITLIGIMSKKDSILYKASDIKLLIPEVTEAGLGIVPTSSTINQLSIGDALAISTLNQKKISKKDFKKFHPSGNLGAKLRTVEEIMITGNKIPFVNGNLIMKKALQIISNKKLDSLERSLIEKVCALDSDMNNSLFILYTHLTGSLRKRKVRHFSID